MSLTKSDVLAQSRSAMDQWGPTWEKNAKRNGEVYKRHGTSHKDLLFAGAGRTLLCIAFSPSFEDNIELLKKYKDTTKVDIACVDKCMSKLLENGITPDYVVLADAGIDYETWCEPYIDQTKEIILITNVTANPLWSENWKGKVVFHVNKDNIESEKIYMKVSGCNEMIPASSNVGNTIIVFSTQVLGYDRYCLLGYDYCWSNDDNYYAFTDSDKRYWMKHLTLVDNSGKMVFTSQNLHFSARWMQDFYDYHRGIFDIYCCSPRGLLNFQRLDLEKVLRESDVRKLSEEEKMKIIQLRIEEIVIDSRGGSEALNKAINETNVAEVIVRHIPQSVIEWMEVA